VNLEQLLVYHSAPTLAGIKAANLISISKEDFATYKKFLIECNKIGNQKGIYFMAFCGCKQRYLLFVYHKKRLEAYLATQSAELFLSRHGYDVQSTLDVKLGILSTRFKQQGTFPHELGIFLEYPVADVEKFIDSSGANAKLCGEWKVYSNVEQAKVLFRRFTKCRLDYLHRFRRGVRLKDLMIA
jgi:hypothetical protein